MNTPTTQAPTFKEIGQALFPVQDPEIRMGITELGLIYGIAIQAGEGDKSKVSVQMSLTSPMCPYGPMMLAMVHSAVSKLPGVGDVQVDLTFEPVWDPRTMASEDCRDKLGIF